ncbi:MAG TPA: PPC domain-containing protein [Gemmatimonadales bacterium]|jgi:hypothetical protein|nr:PPC domain-containing protein [Gemmatimonadales bacterium]
MRFLSRLPGLAPVALALAGVAVTCTFPTDKSNEVFVVVTPSDSLLARGVLGQGQTEHLFATAWRRLPSGDSTKVENVDFFWSSDDNTVARVERLSGGAAEITGIDTGTVAIRAKAAGFEQSSDGAMPVRIALSFFIDSIRPLNIGYAGKLSVYGVRVNQIFFMDQGFGTLIPDEFSFTGSLEGLGKLDFWVPFPSTSAHPFYFGPGFFGLLADSVTVGQDDIFEPNYALPTLVDINGAGGPRKFSGDPVLFYNPALYYEPYDSATDGPFPIDWYRLAQADTTQAMTLIISSQVFDDTAFQYVSDSIYFDGVSNYVAPAWLNAPGLGFYLCGIDGFGSFRETRTPTTFVALRTLPGKALHLFSNYGKDGGYAVVVVRGYQTQDRRIGPDRFEENENWCRWADANFFNSTDSSITGKHIVVGLGRPWRDSTLTIDNAHDIDWYRFRVQAPVVPADTMTTIHTRALPFGFFDFSDIDLYVKRISDSTIVAAAANPGSNETISLNLAAGDYYLGVVDAAAVPTRYSVCMVHGGAGVNCIPPTLPGAPAPGSVTLAPSVYQIPRLPPLEERLKRARIPFALPR